MGLTLFLAAQCAVGQRCTCGEDIERLAYSEYHLSESADVQSYLSTFFNMTDEQRKTLVQGTTSNTGLEALTKDMYLNYTNDQTSDTRMDEFRRLEQQFRQRQSFSQSDLVTIYRRVVSDDARTQYNECMKTCYGGIRLFLEGDETKEFIVTVSWTPRNMSEMNEKKPISVNLTGMTPINTATIYDAASLAAGSSLTQTYRRLDPYSKATIVVSVPGYGQDALDLVAKDKEVAGDVPLGTIVASTLNYEKYLHLYSNDTYAAQKTKWVPCDGRSVSGSAYAREIQANVPDLRGRFIRGANQMWSTGEPTLDAKTANPDALLVGAYQPDALQDHRHDVPKSGATHPDTDRFAAGDSGYPNGQAESLGAKSANVSSETRPKNVTLYFYIRINQ